MNSSEFKLDIARYLLGLADVRTAQEMRAYIALGDEETVQLARDARSTLNSLMAALRPAEPSMAMRTALMQRIDKADESASADAGGRLKDQQIGLRRLPFRFTMPPSLAAALALVVVTVVALFSVRQNIQAQRKLQQAAAQQNGVESAPTSEMQGAIEYVTALQSYFDLIPLRSSSEAGTEYGRLLVNRREGLCFVFAPMLHGADSNAMSYGLRITPREAEPFVAGHFNVDARGSSLFRIDWPKEQDIAVATAAVVRSGRGGEAQPIEELLIGDFPR